MHAVQTECDVLEAEREKRCFTCGEYWPADEEFFLPSRQGRDGLSQRCRACVKEGLWTYVPRMNDDANRS
jgi:hypothetical protein